MLPEFINYEPVCRYVGGREMNGYFYNKRTELNYFVLSFQDHGGWRIPERGRRFFETVPSEFNYGWYSPGGLMDHGHNETDN